MEKQAWLSIEEAAVELNLSARIIRAAIRKGEKGLRSYQPGGKGTTIRIWRPDLEAWVRQGQISGPRPHYVSHISKQVAERTAGRGGAR